MFYYLSASNLVSQVVNQATTPTVLVSAPNPSAFEQSVTLTAIVSPSSATGTVNFFDGTTFIGSGTLSGGIATLTISTLVAEIPVQRRLRYKDPNRQKGKTYTYFIVSVDEFGNVSTTTSVTIRGH